jgi:hypothetical protein
VRINEATELPLRLSELRDELDLSASANLITPSVSMLLFPVFNENEMRK